MPPAAPIASSPQSFDLAAYQLRHPERVMTPALVIYRDLVAANIATTLRLLNGQANRWRPHVKTAKLAFTMKMLTASGVTSFKCATSLELLTAIRSGAKDVLVAYPLMGANAARVRQIAAEHPQVSISVLADNLRQVESWRGSQVGIFLDINPGMDRTGISQANDSAILQLARAVKNAALDFRGLHYYDGQLTSLDLSERTRHAHAGYDRLLALAAELEAEGISVHEVITAGTPALPCSLSYPGFEHPKFLPVVSPGTVVYCDATAMRQLPPAYGYSPAVAVLTQVVSQPATGIITCDAGHKSLSVDSGVPNCVVAGFENLQPQRPSEEHLPIRVPAGISPPEPGSFLYLIPQHVCPTVNNFDFALIAADGEISHMESVDARGREAPLLSPELAAR